MTDMPHGLGENECYCHGDWLCHHHAPPRTLTSGGGPVSQHRRLTDAAGERVIPATLDDMNEWEYEASENPHPNGIVQSARLLRVIAAYRAALSTAEREREELRDAMDSIYVERYGITYRELEDRVRAVQNGEYVTHEEAMQRIRASLDNENVV